jgi:acetylornithine/N-succinyldiaminopimelate aminotransferase
VTVAKPIGGGLPLGAILGSSKVADVWTYGVHGTTFGGNPVACAAGLAVLNTLTTHEMQAHINAMSEYLFAKLKDIQQEFSVIKEVRGMGLMIGIELHRESAPVVDAMLAKGVLANATAATVVRILPPLILSEKEADTFLTVFQEVLTNL